MIIINDSFIDVQPVPLTAGPYAIKNSSTDDFPDLVCALDLLDRAGCVGLWRKRCFEKEKGYSQFKLYELKSRSKDDLSTKEAIADLGSRMFVGQATTRELLMFAISHREFFEMSLGEGKKFVGLGRDEFGARFNSASTLSFVEGARVLDQVSLFTHRWSLDHLFLVRLEDRSL